MFSGDAASGTLLHNASLQIRSSIAGDPNFDSCIVVLVQNISAAPKPSFLTKLCISAFQRFTFGLSCKTASNAATDYFTFNLFELFHSNFRLSVPLLVQIRRFVSSTLLRLTWGRMDNPWHPPWPTFHHIHSFKVVVVHLCHVGPCVAPRHSKFCRPDFFSARRVWNCA